MFRVPTSVSGFKIRRFESSDFGLVLRLRTLGSACPAVGCPVSLVLGFRGLGSGFRV